MTKARLGFPLIPDIVMPEQFSAKPMELRFAEAPSPLLDFHQRLADQGKSVRRASRLPACLGLNREPKRLFQHRTCLAVGGDAFANLGETRICLSLLDERPAPEDRSVGREAPAYDSRVLRVQHGQGAMALRVPEGDPLRAVLTGTDEISHEVTMGPKRAMGGDQERRVLSVVGEPQQLRR